MIPKRITLHCTASPNGKYIPFELIKRWHTDPPPHGRGYREIGYHHVINVNGEMHLGRPANVIGAHVFGHNEDNVGIALVGTDKFSGRQLDALRSQLDSLLLCLATIERWEIYCHYEFDTARAQGKTCPNIDIRRLLRWYYCYDHKAVEPYLLKDYEVTHP